MTDSPVQEVRVSLTVDDFDAALTFYRDVLGLPEEQAYADSGRVSILGAGRATIEIIDAQHAAEVDEIEVGRRVAGPVRLALRVEDSAATAQQLADAGATIVGGPVVTPWNDRNVRLDPPEGVQLTLFTVSDS
ncbi:MAG TPA: VOC family protein [Jatrophihabitantaceae bacterium]|jgi:catechol 2,3-dioxygenase-like lactoylglutathione lyase family enzyme